MKFRILPTLMLGLLTSISSCSLEEVNPSGFTIDAVAASSVEGYRKLINNCYFGMERQLYGYNYWMMLCEAGTDIWTYQKNGVSFSQFFKYNAGAAANLTIGKDVWNSCYDGIGSCNTAISYASVAPFTTEEERNKVVAEAYFLRAMYYYNLVEQFGGVTLTTTPSVTIDLRPTRTAPLDIYNQVIIPDLQFAVQWLPIDNGTTKPSKKSALGFLARAYLQTVEYDDSRSLAGKALETAKMLIDDCEGGGAKYNTFLYPTFSEVFLETNNYTNKESLWSHRFVVGGVSNNAWNMNMNSELFYAVVTDFGAIQQVGADYTTWGRRSGGQFMPSAHLLDLFLQPDGTLDPRYHQSFQTSWTVNKPTYSWTDAALRIFDRSADITNTTTLSANDTAIQFVHRGEPDYASKVAGKLSQPYLVVDHADVYNTTTKSVKMQYNRVNRPLDGGGTLTTNPFFSFYPSLTKHNSSNYYTNNPNNNRYGNLNATFMMRMSEVYLIAAEADLYANGGGNALQYLNRIRSRAGAVPLGGVTIETILDERARELCGEYVRFYDLKRTKKLNKAYLMSTNPDVGQFFNDNQYEVRAIPSTFLNTLQDGGAYYQNPNY
ncbi:RagB/SusD family nutrient uptake outer membrane protein [Chitinophaga rhizophila]|uniref:RagB/SusD family nutrient uptake outer membrane protein n=1 Tax=Chitinophaga rhizophila TaxID=2866212 RepID=A0ABS7G4Y8_9BACT|nr:RagB/SusD family nutrient uptake outer membrane protein [Chitinophaga rhizophila]MBW8682714.1 RagB/SusD family nutrient uptake outer membrane protein [Chitinophaga rhizophila]